MAVLARRWIIKPRKSSIHNKVLENIKGEMIRHYNFKLTVNSYISLGRRRLTDDNTIYLGKRRKESREGEKKSEKKRKNRKQRLNKMSKKKTKKTNKKKKTKKCKLDTTDR